MPAIESLNSIWNICITAISYFNIRTLALEVIKVNNVLLIQVSIKRGLDSIHILVRPSIIRVNSIYVDTSSSTSIVLNLLISISADLSATGSCTWMTN
jgi:hypothetical protein